MNKIILFRIPHGWAARFEGPHAAEVRAAFSTNVIPTAFTDLANPDDVLSEVERLNPDAEVFLEVAHA